MPAGRKNDASRRCKLTVSVLRVETSSGRAPTQPGGRLAQGFVERDPCGALVEVGLHAVARPGLHLRIDRVTCRQRLGTERLAGEVDPRRPVRPDGEVEAGAIRRQRIGGILLQRECLVRAHGRRVRGAHAVATGAVAGAATGWTPQELEGGPAQHPVSCRGRELRQRLDRGAGHGLAEGERIVRPQRDPIRADDPGDEPQRLRIVGQRVHVDPSDGLARLRGRRGRGEVRPGMEAGLHPPEEPRECAAAMGEQQAQRGMSIEDAAQHDRRDGKGQFGRHPHQPRQPVTSHPLRRQHVPRVHEHGRAERRSGGQDGFDGRDRRGPDRPHASRSGRRPGRAP